MSKPHYAIERETITDITDAIRTKCGTHDPIALSNIPNLIANIPQSITGYPLKRYVQRGDAERVERWVHDKLWVQDLGKTLPTYGTSAKSMLTGANLTPTHTLDYANYNYFVMMRGIVIPVYSNAPAKGRTDYTACYYAHEIVSFPANTTHAMNGTAYASRATAVQSLSSIGRTVYWSSASAIAAPLTNVTYGFYINGQAPVISSGVLTIKAPNYGCRGHTTYCTSGNWSKMTDIRHQWVIELWRVPTGHGTDGWHLSNGIEDCFTDINNGGTLVPV